MRVHFFQLDFSPARGYARFPFIVEGLPLSGISCAVSGRALGDMRYLPDEENPNRTRFFREIGLEAGRVRSRVQTHTRDVAVAGEDGARPGDGLATDDQSLALAVTVADCLPVFLFDTERNAFALVHSGWKGTGIAAAALALMSERWGTRAEAVAAILGPCIRSCCYGVDEGRASVFLDEFGEEGEPGSAGFPLGPVVRREGGRAFLDLQAANARLLAAAGVRDLAVCEDCTFTDERLGSFRREGDRYTRMAAVVGRLREENL